MENGKPEPAAWPFEPLNPAAEDQSPRPGGTATPVHKEEKEARQAPLPGKPVDIRPQAT